MSHGAAEILLMLERHSYYRMDFGCVRVTQKVGSANVFGVLRTAKQDMDDAGGMESVFRKAWEIPGGESVACRAGRFRCFLQKTNIERRRTESSDECGCFWCSSHRRQVEQIGL